MSFFRVPLWFGRLHVKLAGTALFSERTGRTPALTIGPIMFVWRRYR
jgi:hypothetical protein